VNGRYKVKHPDMVPLHREAMGAFEQFERWSLRSVPRAQNADADALVNRALDDGGPVHGGETEYHGYLRIDDLLRLQQPITPGAHDELLFIIVHQSYELWFKLILHELAHAQAQLERDRPQAALAPLRRLVAIDRLLLEHLNVLETMGPEGFLEFRDPLAPASGFQSQQFRAIEAGSPRLYDAFVACAELPAAREQRLAALADLYRDHLDDPRRAVLHDVAELLVDHDESIARWRHHHTLMAAREIGSRPGTGGSRGVEYLRSTQDKRFYPELWEVRVEL
jgi:tryptophan 2,3-dioxygenase